MLAHLEEPVAEREKWERVVEARMKLKARFESAVENTPARSDKKPRGSGVSNRHGMPKLPPGQHVTTKWPVLDLGGKPSVSSADWRLQIDGACEHPVVLSFQDFMALEQVEDTSDFHCVTAWSKMDVQWRGVR